MEDARSKEVKKKKFPTNYGAKQLTNNAYMDKNRPTNVIWKYSCVPMLLKNTSSP